MSPHMKETTNYLVVNLLSPFHFKGVCNLFSKQQTPTLYGLVFLAKGSQLTSLSGDLWHAIQY